MARSRCTSLALIACTALGSSLTGLAASAQDAAPKEERTTVIKEVVITATRSSQVMSKVPISVSAFSQDKMDQEGVRDFSDIARYTPGVTFDADTKDISIRGISSNAGDATTGIYIDDTPIQIRDLGFGSNNSLPIVFDLDRVEVLRGPQGTLFGAGSEGGTVRYITPAPSLSKFSTYARTEVSSTENGAPSYEAGVAVGGPLIQDKLGLRLSADYRHDGGFVNRIDPYTGSTVDKNANWENTYVWRAAVKWQPVDNLIVIPTLSYQNRNQNDTDTYNPVLSNPGSSLINDKPDRTGDSDHFYLATLKVEWDLGKVKLLSDTSGFNRREYTTNQAYDGTLYNLAFFGGTYVAAGQDPANAPCAVATACLSPNLLPPVGPYNSPLEGARGPYLPGYGGEYHAWNSITNAQQNFTEELRLQGNDPGSKLTWTAGLFFQDNRQESIEEIHDPQLGALMAYLWGEDVVTGWSEPLLASGDDYYNRNLGHTSQLAAFGEATYALTEKLKLTAGLRLARTHFDVVNYADGPQNYGPFAGPKASKNETPVTPKVSLAYQATSDDMVYGTISKGYRVGGGNPPLSAGLVQSCAIDLAKRNLSNTPLTYNSDSVWSYEVGTKDKFLDKSVSIATSLYHLDWQNIQYKDLLVLCGINYTTNLGAVASDGFDFQGSWRVTPELELDLAAGYTDARFTKDGKATPTADPVALKGETIGGPPFTLTLGVRYDFDLYGKPSYVRVDDEYASKNTKNTPTTDPNNGSAYDPNLVNPPATNFMSMRFGVKLRTWDVSLFADNVLNAHPELSRGDVTGTSPYVFSRTFRPLTVGVTGVYRY